MNTYKLLIKAATCARNQAYAPYSQFKVGAALLDEDSVIHTGCNVENASYGLTCCAERVALYKAVCAGAKRFRAICIVGGKADSEPNEPCVPCGICRQALAEFCDDDMIIVFADGSTTTLGELLPQTFRLER